MNSLARLALVAVSLSVTSPVVAATSITFTPIGSTSVGVFGNLNPSGSNTDEYTFSFPTAGDVAGFVGSIGLRFTRTNLDFTSVTLNGQAFDIDSKGVLELRTIDVPVLSGPQLLSVGYSNAQRFSSYGGILTFTPSVSAAPEPGVWAMMIVGFGMAGSAMRYRRRRTTVTFA